MLDSSHSLHNNHSRQVTPHLPNINIKTAAAFNEGTSVCGPSSLRPLDASLHRTSNQRLHYHRPMDATPSQRAIYTAPTSIHDRWCEETLAATMELFTLDHALSSAAVQFTRSDFLTYILETKVPGLHFHVDDEEKLPNPNMSTHMLIAGRPRIVDGAREDHLIAGLLQDGEGRDSDNAVMKILEEQGSEGDPSPGSEEDQKFTGGEPGDVVSDGVSHSQCLEFLFNRGTQFLMKNLPKDKETVCSVLLVMAEHVKVLPPGNEALPWDVLDMTLWKASLCELMKEMKTVEEKCSPLMGTSGVYVLTKSPYSAFLRALSAEIADAAVKIQLDN